MVDNPCALGPCGALSATFIDSTTGAAWQVMLRSRKGKEGFAPRSYVELS
jgi:hypothetical protein